MADILGLTLQSFSSAIEGFVILQTARKSRKDCEDLFLQLSFLEVRFARWGNAIGIASSEGTQNVIQHIEKNMQPIVQDALKMINDDFEGAKTQWGKLVSTSMPTTDSHETTVDNSTQSKCRQALSGAATKIVRARKSVSAKAAKFEWAISGRSDFMSLVEGLDRKVSYLTQLCPAPGQDLLRAVHEEIGELQKQLAALHLSKSDRQEAFDLLREACRNDALILVQLDQEAKASASGSTMEWFFEEPLYEVDNMSIGPKASAAGKDLGKQRFNFNRPVHRGGTLHIGPS